MIMLILAGVGLTIVVLDVIIRMKARRSGRHIVTPHEFLESMWKEN